MNHTRGPWIVLTDSPSAIQTGDGTMIASEVPNKHDANLISASPEMLACLIELVGVFGYHDQRKISKQLKQDAIARAKKVACKAMGD